MLKAEDMELEKKCCFLELPWDLHVLIWSFLSPEDLARLRRVCKYLCDCVGQCNEVWKHHCEGVWLVTKLEEGCWYECWCRMIREYGRYRHCYAQVKRAWTVIEGFLLSHKISLNVPLTEKRTEEEIAKAEQDLGLTFPDDLRCSLRLHDGLSSFLGVIEFYYFQSILTLHSLKDLVQLHRDASEDTFYCPSAGNTQYLQIGSGWPGKNTAAGLLLALPQCGDVEPGHVVWVTTVRWVERPSFSGQSISYGGVLKHCSVGIIGKSMTFKDWLTEEARKLPCYPIAHGPRGEAHIMRFYQDPKVVATTGHFTVRVGTVLDPSMGTMYQTERSDAIPIMPLPIVPLLATGGSYSYWVEIRMHEDAPQDDSCQLVSRHWVIRSAGGDVERVDGDGIIGETPIFTPGHLHQYASCTRFVGEEYSTMEGHFTMRHLRNGERFNIQVPRFHMPRPDIKWL